MKLGICTGGGDCPGLNAAIRGVVKYANQCGIEVYGIRNSFNGLFADPLEVSKLESEAVSDILNLGGTILGTYNRGNPFHKEPEKRQVILQGIKKVGLDGVIVIGGEGTQGMARALIDDGAAIIGIPKTIDNDLPGTEQTIGFATSVDIVSESVERLRSTAESHDRVMVLEVMGRDSGYIALHGGIAGGSHAILIPEIPFSYESLCRKIRFRKDLGRNYSLIVVSEGAHPVDSQAVYQNEVTGVKNLRGIGQIITEKLYELTQMDTRYTVLGHLQRGGPPNAVDRLLANRFAHRAVQLAVAKNWGRLVTLKQGCISDIAYQDINPSERRKLDPKDEMIQVAESIGICMGR